MEIHTEKAAIALLRLGQMPYNAAWAMQRELAQRRSAGLVGDTLLLLGHPHTYTLGRATKEGHFLVPPALLAAQGAEVIESDRGGDVTYHGPGQIVGYPILKLSRHGGDVARYLRMLEDVIIVTLARYGLPGQRIGGLTGVWVGQEKICAIGVKLSSSGVTQHGFALNLSTDLSYFQKIVPCGIEGKGVTSIERLLGAAHAPSRAELEQAVVASFAQVFAVEIAEAAPPPDLADYTSQPLPITR
ncbi:lipoyl(octanoyl) transferase LipB [Chloroflexia bacterium SDU3-3]|nr:lipoyl(octanoyl) transferase LipB [Chloroflexia bacterium SDU3-3]